jgi:hypothetical protein
MKKYLISSLLALTLLCIPTVVLAAGFSVSPSSEQIVEVPKDGTTTIDFTFPGYAGEVTIGKENLPLDISPLGPVDVSLGEVLTITISGDGTNNTYNGKLTFLASGETQVLVGIKVRLTVHVSLTTDVVVPVPSVGGGGDGGGITDDVDRVSSDGDLHISAPAGTVVHNAAGNTIPAYYIQVNSMASPPAPPENSSVIGLAYDLQPSGATFNPPIPLTFTYDPAQVPDGADESELIIAFWDGNQWVELDCIVDTDTHTITASVAHFTIFAVLATVPVVGEPTPVPPTPEPPPTPREPDIVITIPPVSPKPPDVVVPAPPATPQPEPVPTPEVPSAVSPEPEPSGMPFWGYLLILAGVAIVGYSIWLWRKRASG